MLDLHTHLAPDLAATDGRLDGVVVETDHVVLDGKRVGPAALSAPQQLQDWLDRHGLAGAAVSPPPPFYRQHLNESAAQAWVRALNDGVLSAVQGRPQLVPLAYLPLEHPELALAELERVCADRRWGGVTAAAGGSSGPLDSDALEPVWSRLCDLRWPVLLHPGHSPDPRLEPYYLSNLLGNPVETGVAAAQLLFGDVLGRHPGLRVLLVHCGGVVPAVLGRWERGITTARPGVRDLSRPLREAARGFWVDSLGHEPALLDLAVETFGADRVVVGSDWPFPMGLDDPVASVAHRGPDFAQAAGHDNVRALVGDLPAWQELLALESPVT
jgi:aminocarboxymuconate-semialdehyde decarboxylase